MTLRAFRSFSQAASAHDLTQSAASQIVHQLEKRLAVQLIDRSTRPLQLTPLGQLYFDGCKVLVEQYEELESSIRHAQRSGLLQSTWPRFTLLAWAIWGN